MIKRFFLFCSKVCSFVFVLLCVYLIYAILAHFCFVAFYFSNYGKSIDRITRLGPVHSYFQKTGWDHVKPCGAFFQEQAQFDKAKECSNIAIQKELNKSIPENLVIPRCFVISKTSSDVSYSPLYKMNAVLLRNIIQMFAIVGLYDADTHSIFLVENHDLAMIYRHELQHYFQHVVDPALIEKNHEGLIWDMCEPRTYTPSPQQREIIRLQESIS